MMAKSASLVVATAWCWWLSACGEAGSTATTPQPDLVMRGYPAGPYGNKVGNTLADVTMEGYWLAPNQTDSTQLTWDKAIGLEDFHRSPTCKCLLIALNSAWDPGSQQEQEVLSSQVVGNPSLCVLGILQEGPERSKTPTRAEVDEWTQEYRPAFPTALGSSATAALAMGYQGIPFHLIVKPDSMKVKGAYNGTTGTSDGLALTKCME